MHQSFGVRRDESAGGVRVQHSLQMRTTPDHHAAAGSGGFRVQNLGCRKQHLGCRVQGSEFRVNMS